MGKLSHIRRLSGFTLIEVCVATIIVALGITAVLQLFATSTSENRTTAQLAVAMGLANNIQELMATATYYDSKNPANWGLETGEKLDSTNTSLDLDDFDGAVFGASSTPAGPIDAGWKQVPRCSQYTQKVFVYKLDPTKLAGATLADSATDLGARKVVIEVWYQAPGSSSSIKVYNMRFLRFKESY